MNDKVIMVVLLLMLSGCNKSGPHEIADGRGVCVDVVEYDGHSGQYVVVSYVDGNGYMVSSGYLYKSAKCDAKE